MPPRTTLAPNAPWPSQADFVARLAEIAGKKKPDNYYIKAQPKRPKAKKPCK